MKLCFYHNTMVVNTDHDVIYIYMYIYKYVYIYICICINNDCRKTDDDI